MKKIKKNRKIRFKKKSYDNFWKTKKKIYNIFQNLRQRNVIYKFLSKKGRYNAFAFKRVASAQYIKFK